MDLQLKDKRVLITGGSKGIGLACARVFAREGAQPVIAARNRDDLVAAAQALSSETGVKVATVACDLAAPGAARTLAAEVGMIDVLVNNAGAIPGGTLAQIDEVRWREAWELKVFGYINLTREYFSRMCERKAGVIVNVIGMAGVAPRYDYLCGGAANASLIAFTKAVGGAGPQHGVRVFGVNPGATRTDRTTKLARQRAEALHGDGTRWQELFKELPFGRLMEAEEAANVIAFGCSPRAGYLSGTVIDLDGGQANAPVKR